MKLDFSQCKTAEDVDKVFKKNKPQIDGYKELFRILTGRKKKRKKKIISPNHFSEEELKMKNPEDDYASVHSLIPPFKKPKSDGCKPSVFSDLLARAFVILEDIVDENECNYDHHGNCQEHGWSDPDIPCPHKRAKKWLVEMGEIKAG